MHNNVEEILEKVLTIIDYKEDKYAFIEEFMNLCIRGAFVEYLKILSYDRKTELLQILQKNDPLDIKEKLEPYMITEEYKALVQESSEKLFQDYLDKIMPIISEEQKNNLYAYFATLTTNQEQTPSKIS